MGIFSDLTDSIGLTDSGAGDRGIAAQADAMNKSNAILEKNYGEAKERYAPYQEKGRAAFQSLSEMANNKERFQDQGAFQGHSGVFGMEDFQQDPGYQFRMKEGQKAIERGAAARGGLGGGATMKALAKYGQGFASNEYQNSYNRFNQDYGNSYNRYNQDKSSRFNNLNTISNYGSNANNAITNAGSNNANAQSQSQLGLGNSIANMELNRGNEMKDLWKQGIGVAAMAACWVARAIFGENNPKWKQARFYVLNIGPVWFKNLYLKRGEKFAETVKGNELLKGILKPLFEYFAWRGRAEENKKYSVSWGALCK